jgi:hypothetical protein
MTLQLDEAAGWDRSITYTLGTFISLTNLTMFQHQLNKIRMQNLMMVLKEILTSN